MFDKNFYPTPDNIVRLMTDDLISKSDLTILEPSAGSGAMLKFFRLNDYRSNSLYCVEINPELSAILKDKKYKIIGSDFLTFKSDLKFDYILMNPPFDRGEEHLLKAFEISNGAEIRCLLNAETIRNPFSKKRELLHKILEDNRAEVKFLGQCFKDAERKTDVEVAYVKLKKAEEETFFNFDNIKKDYEKVYDFQSVETNQITKYDLFQSLEERFDRTSEALSRLVKAYLEIEFYSIGTRYKSSLRKMVNDLFDPNPKKFYNAVMDGLRQSAWDYVFEETKIAELTTSKVRTDFYNIQKEQGLIPFTAVNIENLLENLFYNQAAIVQKCVEESFDLMTRYHDENRCHIEGWKTNDRWKVNRKVILPFYIDKRFQSDKQYTLSSFYNFADKLRDIEKSLSFISGKKFKEINSILDHKNQDYGELYDSEFFEYRVYKKGTIHLKFKDDFVYEQFNLIACKSKNWLKESA